MSAKDGRFNKTPAQTSIFFRSHHTLDFVFPSGVLIVVADTFDAVLIGNDSLSVTSNGKRRRLTVALVWWQTFDNNDGGFVCLHFGFSPRIEHALTFL